MSAANDMNKTMQGDEELALALKAGDQRAFDELVHRHQGRVFAVAYRVTGNREDALDVAQEVFLKAYRKIHTWQPTSGFLPWLLRLTTNQSIDLIRWRNRRRHEPLEPESGTSEHADHAVAHNTEGQVRAGEIDDRVQIAIGVLSPAQKTVFILRHYEGLQLNEIADTIGCTVGSVKVHLFRALKKMQVELRDLHDSG
jgi:RNA polymerase sigma-70 factor (ECF subfamily)